MKQQWTTQELLDHWTLIAQEMTLIQSVSQTAYNQFGYGLIFKIFQRDGKFPQRKQDLIQSFFAVEDLDLIRG